MGVIYKIGVSALHFWSCYAGLKVRYIFTCWFGFHTYVHMLYAGQYETINCYQLILCAVSTYRSYSFRFRLYVKVESLKRTIRFVCLFNCLLANGGETNALKPNDRVVCIYN